MSILDWFRSASPRRDAAVSYSVDYTPIEMPMAPIPRSLARMYKAAEHSRLTAGWMTPTSSADNEIRTSLTALRARSRALVRDSAYAKRAKAIVVNNVIGSGIGLQAQVKTTRDTLADRINDAIESKWERWSAAEFCHTGGTLHFSDFERALIGEVFEAGEVFVRMRFAEFGGSGIPFALELVESERVPHEFSTPAADARLGIEVDQFGRPLAYWIRERHPNDIQPGGVQSDRLERVSASDVIHLRLVDRWPQTRGVPWMHAVLRKANDMDGYTEAEIIAARATAQPVASEESADPSFDPTLERQEDGSYQQEWQPGTIYRPPPGKKMTFFDPTRPNAALDGFMRYMLREFASGIGYGVRYSALSGDYSQANYSSERAASLDDRDGWRALQQWFIRAFRCRVHRLWLQQSVFARSIEEIPLTVYGAGSEKFEAVRFRPRGWSWIDPTSEVEAYKDAVRSGFMTQQEVVAATSSGAMDFDEVVEQREKEIALVDAAGLVFDTNPKQVSSAGQAQAPESSSESPHPREEDDEADPEEQQRMRVVK